MSDAPSDKQSGDQTGDEQSGERPVEEQSGEPAVTAVPPQVGTVLEAFKDSLNREFSAAERLTSKARQAFVLSIGFFTIVQTVAF